MQLQFSPSLRHLSILSGKGPRRISFRKLFYSSLFSLFLLRFIFLLSTFDTIDDEHNCFSIGCLGRKLGLHQQVPEIIYQILEEPIDKNTLKGRDDIPQNLDEFVAVVNEFRTDAKSFAVKLREMVTLLEERTRAAKINEYLYRHVASSGIPKQLHCLTLRLTNEHSNSAAARVQLPSPEMVPALVDNSYFHFVLASDNILAASVVAKSLVKNSLRGDKVVLHVITDKKTFSAMQAWFSLHPLSPAIIEVKALHHFDWFTKGKVPVLEAMEKDQKIRAKYRGGSSEIVSNKAEKPYVIAAKLQALSPKYNSLMNHIRIHLPEFLASLNS